MSYKYIFRLTIYILFIAISFIVLHILIYSPLMLSFRSNVDKLITYYLVSLFIYILIIGYSIGSILQCKFTFNKHGAILNHTKSGPKYL